MYVELPDGPKKYSPGRKNLEKLSQLNRIYLYPGGTDLNFYALLWIVIS